MLEEAENESLGTFVRRILENRFPVPDSVGKSNKTARNTRRPVLREVDAEN